MTEATLTEIKGNRMTEAALTERKENRTTETTFNEEYETGIQGNFCVLDSYRDSYAVKTLVFNKIKGIIPVRRKYAEDGEKLCYEISSKETLKDALGHRQICGADVGKMLLSIKEMTDELKEYLLNESDVMLDSRHIFVENESMDLSFMIYPGYEGDFGKELSMILRDIFSAVDNSDHEGVVMAYSLYQASLKETYVLSDLISILDRGVKDNYH